MIKVLVFTFSQTGSTKKVADKIAKGLSESGFEVTHSGITGSEIPDIKEFDIIGIGTPTYFFRPPFIVTDFIRNLKWLKGKSSFVFITHGTARGNCGNQLRSMLKLKDTRDLGYFHSYGADYWLGYIKRGVLFSPGSPDEVELAFAEKFGKKVAERYTDQNPAIDRYDPATHFMYAIERIFMSRPMAKWLHSRTFQANRNCNLCGICVEKCPVDNITLKESGKLKWHSKCLLCATCELSCPKDAIHSALDWKMIAPFMVYNINRSKKKAIPFANVSHSGGKTKLVVK